MTRDLNWKLAFGKEDKRSCFEFQIWFNGWRDFGWGIKFDTPQHLISFENWFSKGGSIPSATLRHIEKGVGLNMDKGGEALMKLPRKGNDGYL